MTCVRLEQVIAWPQLNSQMCQIICVKTNSLMDENVQSMMEEFAREHKYILKY